MDNPKQPNSEPAKTPLENDFNLDEDLKFSDSDAPIPAAPEGWRRTKSGKKNKKRPSTISNISTIRLPKFVEQNSYGLVNFIGYSFLIFSIFDYIALFIPLRLTDPLWEFQVFGQLVERVAIPLLAMLFIFYRQENSIPQKEFNLLKSISWLCLVASIFYILLLPLGIVNTFRINNRNNAQIASQANQQSQQIKQGRDQINKASQKELSDLLNTLNQQGRGGNINSTQELKQVILNRSDKLEEATKLQAMQIQSNQKTELFKNSIKWNLGTILASLSFFWFWRATSWLRVLQKTAPNP